MNDLSGSAAAASVRRRFCDPVPSPIPCLLPPLFLSGLAVSVFILVVVRNAFSLAFLLVLSALVLGFVLWNIYKFRGNGALLLFLDRMPASDLRSARDGQIVKITGFASCGDLALESSYEKIERCIYSSTLLYEYRGFGSQTRAANSLCSRWNLTYVESFGESWFRFKNKSCCHGKPDCQHFKPKKRIVFYPDEMASRTPSFCRTTPTTS